jgi:hypothetical protein
MMKGYKILLFWICLNLAFSLLYYGGVFAIGRLGTSPYDVIAQFNYNNLLYVSVAGIGAGLIGLLLKQYVFAGGALLIWVIGIFTPIVTWFFTGPAKIIEVFMPADGSLWYLPLVIEALSIFVFFFSILEIASQRQIT